MKTTKMQQDCWFWRKRTDSGFYLLLIGWQIHYFITENKINLYKTSRILEKIISSSTKEKWKIRRSLIGMHIFSFIKWMERVNRKSVTLYFSLSNALQRWLYCREHLNNVWNVYCAVTNYMRDLHTTEATEQIIFVLFKTVLLGI